MQERPARSNVAQLNLVGNHLWCQFHLLFGQIVQHSVKKEVSSQSEAAQAGTKAASDGSYEPFERRKGGLELDEVLVISSPCP